MKLLGRISMVLLAAACVYGGARLADPTAQAAGSGRPVPLKEAKLNIEHNATDRDTGFQGFVDSEGWRRLRVRGPEGRVLNLRGRGSLGKLGLTELFFETVEPENADTPIRRMLAKRRVVTRSASRRGARAGERRAHRAHAWQGLAHPRHPERAEAGLAR